MKKIFFISLLIIILLMCLFRFKSLSFIFIKTDNNISKDKIVVEYNSPTLYSQNKVDSTIELTYRNKIIFSNRKRFKIPEEYGENDFQIIYDSTRFGVFRHFKKKPYRDFIYILNFHSIDDKIKCDVKIYGIKGLVKETTINVNGTCYQYLGVKIPKRIPY